MKKLLLVLSVVFGMAGVVGLSQPAMAATCPEGTLHAGANKPLAECNLPDPETGETDITTIISNVINVIIGLVGVVAVVVMILGGITFITSQGDSAKVTKAKNTILYGIVGLVVAMLAFAIVNFVLGALKKPTSKSGDEEEAYHLQVAPEDYIA